MNLMAIILCFIVIITARGDSGFRDCVVTTSKRYTTEHSLNQTFIAHISKSYGVTIDLYYHDLDEDFYTDRVSLSLSKEDTIYSTRNGKMNTTMLNSLFEEAGWTYIDLSITNNSMVVNNISYDLDFAGDLSAYSFGAKLFTDCQEMSPTWLVTEGHHVDVPWDTIRDLSISSITLEATEEFHPILSFGNVSFSSDIIAASPLPRGNYTLDSDQLMNEISSQMTDTTKYMEDDFESTIVNVTSQKGNFTLTLHISMIESTAILTGTTDSTGSRTGLKAILAILVILAGTVGVLVILKKMGYIHNKKLNYVKRESNISVKFETETAQPMIDKQPWRENHLELYREAMGSEVDNDGDLLDPDELTKLHNEAIRKSLKHIQENYKINEKDKLTVIQEFEAEFREIKNRQQEKLNNMLIQATSDGLKEYRSTMPEVMNETLALLSEQELYAEHTKCKENAQKKFQENIKQCSKVSHSNTSEIQIFTQSLVEEYEQFKTQHEYRKTKTLTEYEAAEIEAKNSYSYNIDKMVSKGNTRKSDWERKHKECLNSAIVIFKENCITAYIAIPLQRQERIEDLMNDLEDMHREKKKKEDERECKEVCERLMKNALEEYKNKMLEKLSGLHKKDLRTHHETKCESAINKYVRDTLFINDYTQIVEEYKKQLKKNIDEAYRNINKKERETYEDKTILTI